MTRIHLRCAPGVLVALTLATVGPDAGAEIATERVEYTHGDAVLEGYLAYDAQAAGPQPGVLVVHEWKGMGPYAERRAEQLAGLGYVAFAVDMYGKGVRAKDHTEAAQLAGIYRNDRQLMRGRIRAALDTLRANLRVDTGRIAAIGYCFGGTTVLELARSGADVLGVASFHGGLDTPAPAAPGSVKAKVLVLHGEADKHIPPEQVAKFEDEMKAAGADYELIVYPDAMHSFTVPDANNPDGGQMYNEAADTASWEALKAFLSGLFKAAPASMHAANGG
jgi:dienelactone hydrolase